MVRTAVKAPRKKRVNARSITAIEKRQFLSHLEKTGSATEAAQRVGRRKTSNPYYAHRDNDPEFAARWQIALDSWLDSFLTVLKAEAFRRGVEGYDKPVMYQGEITDSYREYSDSLLLAMLKANDPSYRDRQVHEHGGVDGGPIQTRVLVEFVAAKEKSDD